MMFPKFKETEYVMSIKLKSPITPRKAKEIVRAFGGLVSVISGGKKYDLS